MSVELSCPACSYTMSLQERFKFYKEVNPPMLAYHFARDKHVRGTGYTIPQYMYMWLPDVHRWLREQRKGWAA